MKEKMIVRHVRFTPEMLIRMDEAAYALGVSVSALVRMACLAELKKIERNG